MELENIQKKIQNDLKQKNLRGNKSRIKIYHLYENEYNEVDSNPINKMLKQMPLIN